MTLAARGSLVGIFVGGRGERMGGVAKGLLTTRSDDGRDVTLIERALNELGAAAPGVPVVLVGGAEPYAHVGLPQLEDEPNGIGPLGGLQALLLEGARRDLSHVLALACDLPFIRRDILRRLLDEQPQAGALFVRTEGVPNPLIARYAVGEALVAVGAVLASPRRSVRAVLERPELLAQPLELSGVDERALRDWDTPEDMSR
ncbi:MAG TPA: molybdenum cofactor guanylyltransferase [Polyangiaceae bacterium]|nr:molybdenum cofactor guanylyltransferase [Polyangiaceae bacterium]